MFIGKGRSLGVEARHASCIYPYPSGQAWPDAYIYPGVSGEQSLELAGGRPNCPLGTGALPYETPPENVRLIGKVVL